MDIVEYYSQVSRRLHEGGLVSVAFPLHGLRFTDRGILHFGPAIIRYLQEDEYSLIEGPNSIEALAAAVDVTPEERYQLEQRARHSLRHHKGPIIECHVAYTVQGIEDYEQVSEIAFQQAWLIVSLIRFALAQGPRPDHTRGFLVSLGVDDWKRSASLIPIRFTQSIGRLVSTGIPYDWYPFTSAEAPANIFQKWFTQTGAMALAAVLQKPEPTDFESSLFDAISWLSLSLERMDLPTRLISLFTALETLLGREGKGFSSDCCKWAAKLASSDINKIRGDRKFLNKAYTLRSILVHSLPKPDPEKKPLELSWENCFRLTDLTVAVIKNLIEKKDRYLTKEDLILELIASPG